MAAKYKQAKRGGPRHVQLTEWFQALPAWATLKPGPRALYIELKRRFNGSNNGNLFLSHRDAAIALNVDRKTVAGYFTELIARGFICATRGHCLGPAGKGQSATYRLTELEYDGKPPTKDFAIWKPKPKKKKPRVKTPHSLAQFLPQGGGKTPHSNFQRRKNSPAFGQNHAHPVGKKRAIYTSSHIPQGKDAALERIRSGVGLCGRAGLEAA